MCQIYCSDEAGTTATTTKKIQKKIRIDHRNNFPLLFRWAAMLSDFLAHSDFIIKWLHMAIYYNKKYYFYKLKLMHNIFVLWWFVLLHFRFGWNKKKDHKNGTLRRSHFSLKKHNSSVPKYTRRLRESMQPATARLDPRPSDPHYFYLSIFLYPVAQSHSIRSIVFSLLSVFRPFRPFRRFGSLFSRKINK